jgi:ribosome recycling factor
VADDNSVVGEAQRNMRASIDTFREAIAGVRTGVAHPGLVENLVLEDGHGATFRVKQVAAIKVVGGDLHIEPWDGGMVSAIQKVISESSLGLMPRVDSKAGKKVIYVAVPKLSEEYRKKLAKEVHGLLEKAKIDLRNVRRSCNDALNKQSSKNAKKGDSKDKVLLSEDEIRKMSTALDKLTDQFIAEASAIADAKQRDLMK